MREIQRFKLRELTETDTMSFIDDLEMENYNGQGVQELIDALIANRGYNIKPSDFQIAYSSNNKAEITLGGEKFTIDVSNGATQYHPYIEACMNNPQPNGNGTTRYHFANGTANYYYMTIVVPDAYKHVWEKEIGWCINY